MAGTCVVFSSIFYRHNPGIGHPESAERLRVIIRELKKNRRQSVGNWRFVEAEKARLGDVGLVHLMEYIELIESTCRLGGGVLDVERDTVASSETYEVALHAVGGTMKAANLIMNGEFRNGFALVRPPGHHAGIDSARGFCIFNNVAIAAKFLLGKFKLKRVLILDIDAHHGNGTQEIFYSTDRVLYVGLHQDPRDFPGTGYVHEIGEGKGLGYNVNIPLPFWTDDEIYLEAMNEVAGPIIQQYRPQFVLVSAGLDGHYADPVGDLSLSIACYQEVFERVVDLASRTCEEKLLLVLEGGYSRSFVGKIALAAIAEMSHTPFSSVDESPTTAKEIREQGRKIISQVKTVQRAFWDV